MKMFKLLALTGLLLTVSLPTFAESVVTKGNVEQRIRKALEGTSFSEKRIKQIVADAESELKESSARNNRIEEIAFYPKASRKSIYERYYYGNGYKFDPRACDSNEPFEDVLAILFMGTYSADADMGVDYDDGWLVIYPKEDGIYWIAVNFGWSTKCFEIHKG